jgi:dihydrofolate synthase/folylpolyglutamate synthase
MGLNMVNYHAPLVNYSEAIHFLYELRVFGLKFGLENTLHLAALAGRPQDKLRFIHVAGTNGKGSTCAMLESIYRAAGLRVGLFTSPHLVSFAERIQVDRKHIAPEDVARLVEEMRGATVFSGGENCPTFFEVVTVMALKYFAEQRCDLVVWETGLGGRLDATNIVTPLASVITNVQLDHQQWLGETLPEIAREKAGIIKKNVPVITGAEDAAALQVIAETARKLHAPLSVVTPADGRAMERYEIALAGEHQRMNAAVAVKTAQILDKQIPVPETALRRGLKETQWAGRWQIVQRDNGQTVLLDGAHNPAGAQMLADAWQREFATRNGALILGIMRDKDGEAICNILAPLARKIFLAPIASERSADPKSMAGHCRQANPTAQIIVCQNLADAFAKAAAEPFVGVTGSLYFVGEALERLGLVPPSRERALNEYGVAPVRAVTFDVGGTLIEPWPSVGDVYGEVAGRHGVQISPEVLNQRFAAAWKVKKNFSYKKSDWSDLVDETFAGLSAKRPSASFFLELYDQFAGAAAWRVYEDVRPCLERLRQNGIQLGIISNWDERLRPLLKALALDRYFDAIVVSVEEGSRKPAPEIFRAAANQLKVPPQAVLHVGDSRVEDFEGARSAGFQALLLTRELGAGNDGAIASLDELDVPPAGNKMFSRLSQAGLISVNSVDVDGANH